MKQLYLLSLLLLLSSTVLRVEAGLASSAAGLAGGVQLKSPISVGSDVFLAGDAVLVDSNNAFECPSNPTTPDTSTLAPADTGAVFINKVFSVAQFNAGFQVIVNFNQSGTYGGTPSTYPGRGFAFTINQVGYNASVADGNTAENLGFRNISGAVGFGLKWPFSLSSPSFSFMPSYSATDPNLSNQTALASINETVRTVTIQYETYGLTTPLLTAYVDDQLVFQSQLDLTAYLSNSTAQAYFGIAGSIGEGFRHTQKFVTGPAPTTASVMDVRTFNPNSRLSISCPRIIALFVKNNVVTAATGRGTVTNGWVAEHYNPNAVVTTDWAPGDILYLQANDSTPNPYCVVELRNNSIPINIVGLWKCVDNPPPTNWTQSSLDDSSYPYGTVYGTNSYTTSFRGFPHVGGISSWAERVWTSTPSSTAAFCRLRVPRYCVSTDLRYCWNSETCVNGLCACVPPFGGVNCTGYVTPTISSVTPTAVPANSSAVLTVTGTNYFSTGTPTCIFTGTTTGLSYSVSGSNVVFINSTTIQCTLPNFSGKVSELISVQIDNGYVSSPKSNTYNISMFQPPSVSTSNPTNSVVGKNVDLTLSGNFPMLPNMAYSIRINSTTPTNCTYVNSTTLKCQVSSLQPGIFPIEVAGDGNFYYSNGSVLFTYFVNDSPYCRGYQTGSYKPVEFPFVPSTDISRGGNITFTKNIAYNTTPSIIATNGTAYGNSTLFDSDFCCTPQVNNLGLYCGNFFPITNTTATIFITFPKPARINEVVTSWNNPCAYLAGAYDLYFMESNSSYTYIKTTTTNNATCVTVSGDNRPVGLCVDYFSNPDPSKGLIDTQKLKITFAVSNDNLPPTSTGAWLYEISVMGIFLDDPWAIKSTSGFWNGNARFSASSTITLSQSFSLSILTINNTVVSSPNVTVSIKLYNSAGTDVTTQYLSVPGGTNQTYSASVFNGAQLINAIPLGNYTLQFTSSGLQSLQVPFSVAPGPPYQIKAYSGNSTSVTILSDYLVTVSPVTVCIQDQLNNTIPADATINVNVSLSAQSENGTNILTFSGATQRTFIGECNSFDFSVVAPKKDTYLISFTAVFTNTTTGTPTNLIGSSLQLKVDPGYASRMIYIGTNKTFDLPASADPNDPPEIQLVDAAGNDLDDNRKTLYDSKYITLSFSPTTALNIVGYVANVSSAVASFKQLGFLGQPGTVYTVTANIDGDTFDPITFPLVIKNCSEIKEDTLADGWECKCKPGYLVANNDCAPCPSGTFSTELGSTECTACPPDQDTYGQTGQTGCVCDEEHVASADGGCEACPTGAICGNNTVIGNQKGYWNDGKNVFYACFVGDHSNPTNDNLRSSYEACPAAIAQGKTVCGEGYTGLACLECADGYGEQSGFCKVCPDKRINWAIIIFALLVILGMLIFLVIQGRTPKNKESVSAKILLNHIQMMSLLASLGAIWTDPFFTFLKIGGVSTFADTQIVSVDCSVGSSFYNEFIFFMLIPIFTVIISTIVYLVVYLVRAYITPCIYKDEDDDEVKPASIRTSVLSDYILCIAVVTFIFYPAICIKALEIFDCNIDIDGNKYLTVAPGEECLTDRWRGFVVWAVIMLTLFCVGVPLFVLFMLYKYRMHPNVHVQIILRFFYDGFKSNRYYWEVVILARKFLIVLFIIVFRFRPIYQIFGMLFVIQGALLFHIIFHPYTSGRQYRLELMSLLSILITLFISLYLADKTDRSVLAAGLSGAVMTMHLFVVASFAFFIGRGLLRRMLADGWMIIVAYWNRIVPKKMQKKEPQFDQVTEMFEQLGKATDYERDQLYAGLENWWKQAPNYKRRRFVHTLEGLSEGTEFARVLKGKKRDNNNNNNDDSDTTSGSESESDANVEMQPLPQ